ncbi:hypothetical protein [Paenibacillus koleovorans]|uniref:hypothetical protein n=1 Tax=Paenibacillus koleovorans TaxID=121608 RepID=UPI000FD9438F|nr:hypothetical protein [Paenibacillus koleovorans]
MRKLLSLRHWGHVFRKVYLLLIAREVPVKDKLLFLIPALLYWVLPDVLPFMPIDDIAVTMLLMNWFAERMERKHFLK